MIKTTPDGIYLEDKGGYLAELKQNGKLIEEIKLAPSYAGLLDDGKTFIAKWGIERLKSKTMYRAVENGAPRNFVLHIRTRIEAGAMGILIQGMWSEIPTDNVKDTLQTLSKAAVPTKKPTPAPLKKSTPKKGKTKKKIAAKAKPKAKEVMYDLGPIRKRL